MEEFPHIHTDRRHNSHGSSQSRLGRFNASFYIFAFTRSMGKKRTLKELSCLVKGSNSNCINFSIFYFIDGLAIFFLREI